MPAPRLRGGSSAALENAVRHEECWAKTFEDGRPGIAVRGHCQNVGCVAEALLDLLPDRLRMLQPPGAATLAALHDIGKVSPGFQQKCMKWLESRGLKDRAGKECWWNQPPDHARTGQFTVQQLLGHSRLHAWAAALGAHHGRIKGGHIPDHEVHPWEDERRRLAAELIAEFGPLPDQPPEEAVLWFVAGLISVADWIGSDETHFPQQAVWDMPARRQRSREVLAKIHWGRAAARPLSGFTDLFPQIEYPNSLQAAVMRTVSAPGIYIIEGPMGCGKTEAALAAAYRLIAAGEANGIYFALPTQLTSNRIHARVKRFVERAFTAEEPVRLAHGSSWLEETAPPLNLHPASETPAEREDARAGRSWFTSSKRALLAPFGVGTVDQALLGIVAAKHFFVRQFGLAGKVVILDEIHTYDLYTGTLIDVLVRRLRELRATVLILSATLTASRRRQLLQANADQVLETAYPLLSSGPSPLCEVPCEAPANRPVAIRFVNESLLTAKCLERAQNGECVLWMRNTVNDAQQTFRALRGASCEGGPEIALLHSRFPFFRRAELESRWMDALGKDASRRPAGCVLVCTQVAEQSVDIDADLLISDLAPTDMLLQRLGRLWRHERSLRRCRRPELWIQSPPLSMRELRRAPERQLREALGKSAKVYAPYVLLRSLEQWRNRRSIVLPAEIREILEATYADAASPEPEAWRQLREEMEDRKGILAACAKSASAIWYNPALDDKEGIQTRFNSYPTAHLLLATAITALNPHSARAVLLNGTEIVPNDRDWSFAFAKAIHLNLTPVPFHAAAKALDNEPGWLANHAAQPTALGLIRADGSVVWPNTGGESGLSYHPEQGIIIQRAPVPRAAQEEFDESWD